MDIEIFRKRRQDFRNKMLSSGVALFFSAALQSRNNDVHYPFRQDSDFFYLTGLDQDHAILVLSAQKERLYVQAHDPSKEMWDGPRLSPDQVYANLDIAEGRPLSNFFTDLPDLVKKHSHLYYGFGLQTERDQKILSCLRNLIQSKRRGISAPNSIVDPGTILHEMRLRKSEHEIELLKTNAAITHHGHLRLMQETLPGMYEYELEALLDYEFRRRDASHAYTPIVASGPNACILHHIQNNRKIAAGDLVLVDAGAEKFCLSTDVTRTFPAGKTFSPEQRDVYEIVLAAQKKAIDIVSPSRNLVDVHDAATLVLIQGLIDLGLLKGLAENHLSQAKEIEGQATSQIISQKEEKNKKPQPISYKRYYMHQTSHWLGMDVHDVGPYYDQGPAAQPIPLEVGMVFTIEPGLYFPSEDTQSDKIPAGLRGIGIRIEDDVCVCEKKPLVLTASIPKQVNDIEQIRST